MDLRRGVDLPTGATHQNGAVFEPVSLFSALCIDFDLGRHIAEVDHLTQRFLENDLKPLIGLIHATQEGSTAMKTIILSGNATLDAMP